MKRAFVMKVCVAILFVGIATTIIVLVKNSGGSKDDASKAKLQTAQRSGDRVPSIARNEVSLTFADSVNISTNQAEQLLLLESIMDEAIAINTTLRRMSDNVLIVNFTDEQAMSLVHRMMQSDHVGLLSYLVFTLNGTIVCSTSFNTGICAPNQVSSITFSQIPCSLMDSHCNTVVDQTQNPSSDTPHVQILPIPPQPSASPVPTTFPMPPPGGSWAETWPIPPLPSPLRLASETGVCNSATCLLPTCRCASTDIPGAIDRDQTPQFVSITFDDHLYDEMWLNGLAGELALNTTARDATGCWPRITWYLTAQGTQWDLVDLVRARGHEIAIHTLTHANPQQFSTDNWIAEAVSDREFISMLSSTRYERIAGSRAPWLQYCDQMFTALYQSGFVYDSSVIERHDSGLSNVDFEAKIGNWLWPYTLDHGLVQHCLFGTSQCPSLAYPGFWEFPMTVNADESGYGSEMDPPMDGDDLLELFRDNFLTRYNGNRAPMNIFLHGTWLTPSRVRILQTFLHYVAGFEGVIFGTPSQVLQWIQNPEPIAQALQRDYLQCPIASRETLFTCESPKQCNYVQGSFRTCAQCPSRYPTIEGTRNNPPAPDQWNGRIRVQKIGACFDIESWNSAGIGSVSWRVELEFESNIDNPPSLWGGRIHEIGAMRLVIVNDPTNGRVDSNGSARFGFCLPQDNIDIASSVAMFQV